MTEDDSAMGISRCAAVAVVTTARERTRAKRLDAGFTICDSSIKRRQTVTSRNGLDARPPRAPLSVAAGESGAVGAPHPAFGRPLPAQAVRGALAANMPSALLPACGEKVPRSGG